MKNLIALYLIFFILGPKVSYSQPWLYWSNSNDSSIRRGTIDGDSSEHVFGDVIHAIALGVDIQDGLFFWSGFDYIHVQGFSGSNPSTLFSDIGPVFDFELDTINNHVYYAEVTSGIYRCNYDGTENELIVDGDAVRGVGLDLSNEKLYWIVPTGEPNRGLWRANLDGTEIELLIYDRLSRPWSLELDETNQVVYWYDNFFQEISRVDLDGNNRETVFTGIVALQDLTIDQSSNTMYWISRDGDNEFLQSGDLTDSDEIGTLFTESSGLSFGRSLIYLSGLLLTDLSPEVSQGISVNIYPNPSWDYLTLDSSERMRRVTIFNVNGQEVLTKPLNIGDVRLEIDKLFSGLYYLKIDFLSGSSRVEEIVVNRR